MSESTVHATALSSQYTDQVTNDLERVVKEQERITKEIAALQEQLTTLEQDYALLASMQQALSISPVPAQQSAAADATAVPFPHSRDTSATSTDNETRTSDAAPKRTSSTKTNEKKSSGRARSVRQGQPTLVHLVRTYLTEQDEPRAAAEVATALQQAHPERNIKTTVVRTTLEGLVGRSQAQRVKQGSSVYYVGPDAPGPQQGDGQVTTD
jgi:hypothetical protein